MKKSNGIEQINFDSNGISKPSKKKKQNSQWFVKLLQWEFKNRSV